MKNNYFNINNYTLTSAVVRTNKVIKKLDAKV